MFSEMTYFNGVRETVEDMLKHYDGWGDPSTYPHMAAGWAVAGDTPFTWTKQVASSFGGTRNGMVVHWPKGITQPGRVSQQHCLTMDWTATILDIAGAHPPAGHELDGVSMRPVLQAAGLAFERPMYWRMKHRQQRAFRLGDWKYLKVDEHEYLFNVARDARERANQARREPARLSEMRERYEIWAAQVPPVPDDAFVGVVNTLADMPAR